MNPSSPRLQAVQYSIEVEGIVAPRWAEWFKGLEVSFVACSSQPRHTLLVATLPDQSALPAVLARVTGLNLKIVSVTPGMPGCSS
ncbi:MAG: hypothetical protein FJZ97_10910 [Chloroflexi bacterium]|nr:hypothetical protein [Chloroflexota bacterium]